MIVGTDAASISLVRGVAEALVALGVEVSLHNFSSISRQAEPVPLRESIIFIHFHIVVYRAHLRTIVLSVVCPLLNTLVDRVIRSVLSGALFASDKSPRKVLCMGFKDVSGTPSLRLRRVQWIDTFERPIPKLIVLGFFGAIL